MTDSTLMQGDCVERMAEIATASVDAIICDPPYPEIDRAYGRMTEAAWWDMMMGVCRESRRVLKPTGSAVFILQPNSRKVGSMRGWLFRFQAWACDEWNMVQDVYWWNPAAMPTVHSNRVRGLMRPSVKLEVWLGSEDCYRNQDEILWSQSEASANELRESRAIVTSPSGHRLKRLGMKHTAIDRGGVTPFNLLPLTNTNSVDSASSSGHGAGTPLNLCDWWVRYISPPDGLVCDPFMGSGTTGLAALKRGRRFVGIERDPGYFATAERRIQESEAGMTLFGSLTHADA